MASPPTLPHVSWVWLAMLPGWVLILERVSLEGGGPVLLSGTPMLGGRGGVQARGSEPGSGQGLGAGSQAGVGPAPWRRRSIYFGAPEPLWEQVFNPRDAGLQLGGFGPLGVGPPVPWGPPSKELLLESRPRGRGVGSQSQAMWTGWEVLPRAGARGVHVMPTHQLQDQVHSGSWSCSPSPPRPSAFCCWASFPWLALACCRPHSAHAFSVTLDLLCSGDETLASSAPMGRCPQGRSHRDGGRCGWAWRPPHARTRDDPRGTLGGSFLLTFAPICEMGQLCPPFLGWSVGRGPCIHVEPSRPALGRSGGWPGLCACPRPQVYTHSSASFRSRGIGPLLGGHWAGTEHRVL